MMNFDFTFKSKNDVTNVWRIMFNSLKEAEYFFTMETTIPASHVASYVYKKDTLYGTEYLYEASGNMLLGYTCIDTRVEESFKTLNLETLVNFIGNVTYWDMYYLKKRFFHEVVTLEIDNFKYENRTIEQYQALNLDQLDKADEERCFLMHITNSLHEYNEDFEDTIINPLISFLDKYIDTVPGREDIQIAWENSGTLLHNLVSLELLFEEKSENYTNLCMVI